MYTSHRLILFGIAIAALIAIDAWHLTIATGIAAIALAAFGAVYATRWHGARLGLYVFLIAEASAISLHADSLTALTYQVCCALLLTALIAPLPQIWRLRTYARPVFTTALIAIVSLTPGALLVYANWPGITGVQATSLSAVLLLLVTGAYAVMRHGGPAFRSALRG